MNIAHRLMSAILWWTIHLVILWSMSVLCHTRDLHEAPLTAMSGALLVVHAPLNMQMMVASFLLTSLSWAWVRISDPGRAGRCWKREGQQSDKLGSTGGEVAWAEHESSYLSSLEEVSPELEEQSSLIATRAGEAGHDACHLCGAEKKCESTKHCDVVRDNTRSLLERHPSQSLSFLLQCGVCIYGWDHHCWWLATCVGQKNHRFFWTYLLFQVWRFAMGK